MDVLHAVRTCKAYLVPRSIGVIAIRIRILRRLVADELEGMANLRSWKTDCGDPGLDAIFHGLVQCVGGVLFREAVMKDVEALLISWPEFGLVGAANPRRF